MATTTTITKFKRQTINVEVSGEGKVAIPALVLGSLAVHGWLSTNPPYQPTNYGYVLTHVPSGYKMADAYKQRSIRALAEKLNALDIDWNFDPADPPEPFLELALPLFKEFISDPNN